MGENVDLEQLIAREQGCDLFVPDVIDREGQWLESVSHCDGIITERIVIGATEMNRLPNCKVIVRLGIGYDNIDLAAATEHCIHVFNVPDYCTEEVANHTLLLLLAASRRLKAYQRKLAGTRDWSFRLQDPPERISGQIVGVCGLGKIAEAFIERLLPLGCRILANTRDPERHRTLIERAGIEIVPLSALLERSDYVVLLIPLRSETRHIISRGTLRLMKPTAWLINTARGGLVDHHDLAAALREGWIAGAALDVTEPEPPDWSLGLTDLPNVLATPHTAFYSRQSLEELRATAIRYASEFLQGSIPSSLVNPDVRRS